jgi:hypothetical protein
MTIITHLLKKIGLTCSLIFLCTLEIQAQVVLIGDNYKFCNNHIAYQSVIERYPGKKILLFEFNFLLSSSCLGETNDSVAFFKDLWVSALSNQLAKQFNNNLYNSSYQSIKKNRAFCLYYDLVHHMKDSLVAVKKTIFLNALQEKMKSVNMSYADYLPLMKQVKRYSYKSASDTVLGAIGNKLADDKKYLLFAMLQYHLLERYDATNQQALRDSLMAEQILALATWFPDHTIIAINSMMRVFNNQPGNIYDHLRKGRASVSSYLINSPDTGELKSKTELLIPEKEFIKPSGGNAPILSLKNCKNCKGDFLVQFPKPVHILSFYFDAKKK